MLKLKLKWHLYWSKWHSSLGLNDFHCGNFNGASQHYEKFFAHAKKYTNLGGKVENVLGKPHKG